MRWPARDTSRLRDQPSISEISSSVAPNAASQPIALLAQRKGAAAPGADVIRLKFKRGKSSPATDSGADDLLECHRVALVLPTFEDSLS
jgi:hypothetical protein